MSSASSSAAIASASSAGGMSSASSSAAIASASSAGARSSMSAASSPYCAGTVRPYCAKTASPVHSPPVRTDSVAIDTALPSASTAWIDSSGSSGSGAS